MFGSCVKWKWKQNMVVCKTIEMTHLHENSLRTLSNAKKEKCHCVLELCPHL